MKEILLISENPEIIQSFTAMLSPVYDVISVRSQQEGLEVLKKDFRRISAVLTDLKLARSDGFFCAKEMQSFSPLSPIPLIAISADLPDDIDMDCIEHGFFDLINMKTPPLLVHQRIGNAIRAKDSLSLH